MSKTPEGSKEDQVDMDHMPILPKVSQLVNNSSFLRCDASEFERYWQEAVDELAKKADSEILLKGKAHVSQALKCMRGNDHAYEMNNIVIPTVTFHASTYLKGELSANDLIQTDFSFGVENIA